MPLTLIPKNVKKLLRNLEVAAEAMYPAEEHLTDEEIEAIDTILLEAQDRQVWSRPQQIKALLKLPETPETPPKPTPPPLRVFREEFGRLRERK